MNADTRRDLTEWAVKGVDQELISAHEQLTTIQGRIHDLERAKRALLGQKEPQHRTLSDEARKRISDAQKKRWAKKKKLTKK